MLANADHRKLIEQYLLNGTKCGLFDPRKLVLLFSQTDIEPTVSSLSNTANMQIVELPQKERLQLVRKHRARSLSIAGKFIKHENKEICPMISVISKTASSLVENHFGSVKSKTCFVRKINSVDQMTDCSGDKVQKCYKVLVSFSEESSSKLSVVDVENVGYEELFDELRNICDSSPKIRFECGVGDFESADLGKIERIIETVVKSKLIAKGSTISRIFYNHEGDLRQRDLEVWFAQCQNFTIKHHHQTQQMMITQLDKEGNVLRQKEDNSWHQLRVEKSPVKATIILSAVSMDGVDIEYVLDMSSFRLIKLETNNKVNVDDIIQFAVPFMMTWVNSEDLEIKLDVVRRPSVDFNAEREDKSRSAHEAMSSTNTSPLSPKDAHTLPLNAGVTDADAPQNTFG
ncbi:hypothetical protein L3Y34_019200 [Caenorhabditis briggsae]|nr:hypothetical protein L3Y34_019200 [Caenorhabditis briggsae]